MSICCPSCGSKTRVRSSDYNDEMNLLVRYRKCPECEFTFSTYELDRRIVERMITLRTKSKELLKYLDSLPDSDLFITYKGKK